MSSATLKIREATFEDAPTLLPFGRQTFIDTYVGHPKTTADPKDTYIYLDEAFSPPFFQNELATEGTKFFVCEEEVPAAEEGGAPTTVIVAYAKVIIGAVEGTLKVGTNPKTGLPQRPIRLQRLYVGKQHIGKRGIGSMLLNHCFEVAKENKCDLFWLGMWGDNTPAVDFYKKHGFHEDGEITFTSNGKDFTNIIMQKVLDLPASE